MKKDLIQMMIYNFHTLKFDLNFLFQKFNIEMTNSTYDFFVLLELFISNLKSIGIFECQTVYIDNININIHLKTTDKSTKCIALVTDPQTNVVHRCSRTKKFGDLCGLHNNRKNTFKTINNDNSNNTVRKFSIKLTKKTKSTDICENNMIPFSWDNTDYIIETCSGNVYYDNLLEYKFLDNISNLNIPIDVY